jgi:hypothetical protein
MRPVLVVVGDKFAKHGDQVLLVEHDEVVEALSPECADDRVLPSSRPLAGASPAKGGTKAPL